MTQPGMRTCAPQQFLRLGGTLEQLKEQFGIHAKRHGEFGNLVHLKYDQLVSPMHLDIVQECRGLILDQDDDWRVIAWPFRKFFNYGELNAAPIDWSSAVVQEKLDGSLAIMYWYDGQWRMATSGTADGSGPVQGTDMTFEKLFWQTFVKMNFVLPKDYAKVFTHIFELTGPLNRIVVPHAESKLHLIGMRGTYSGTETLPDLSDYNPVRTFPLQSVEDILRTFETMDPLNQEGYVVVDAHFNRVKVKHPGYVALHHLKSSFNVKRIVEVVRGGESAEVLTHFPEWKRPFEIVRASYDGLVTACEQRWKEIQNIEPRKAFAQAALDSPHFPTMFLLKDGRVSSVQESLQRVHIDDFVRMLGVKGLVLEGAI